MSMQDPVADMLTRIRNGQMANHTKVSMGSSKQKEEIARVLKEEGYILSYFVSEEGVKKTLNIELKYFKGRPVIDRIKRISKPGLRIYKASKDLVSITGFGIQIVSTSKGMMTHASAQKNGIGGEIVCEVA